MNLIKIDEEWQIKTDPYNWIVCYKKKGNKTWQNKSYYGSLEQAINGFIKCYLEAQNCSDIQNLADEEKVVISKLIKELGHIGYQFKIYRPTFIEPYIKKAVEILGIESPIEDIEEYDKGYYLHRKEAAT